jgi:hypothetical protein
MRRWKGVRSSGWGRTGPECLADFSDIIWINATSAEQHPSELSTLQVAQCSRASCGWVTVCHRGLAQERASTMLGANDGEIRSGLETGQPP